MTRRRVLSAQGYRHPHNRVPFRGAGTEPAEGNGVEINYDFDGSLRLSDVVEDFFFSESTGQYVCRHPLVVDQTVLEAADELGVRPNASPEKWIVNTNLAACLKILDKLGSKAMSLPEFFRVRRDAVSSGDLDMLSSLESDQFVEMLATVFLNDKFMIHNPRLDGSSTFAGDAIPVHTPEGRYGWIDPEKVDLATGLPTEVSHTRNIEDNTLKYWDTHTEIGAQGTLMAVRGYVTSVGKISIDLGFPADAVSHRLSIRECRSTRPIAALDESVLDEAKHLLSSYYSAVSDGTLFKQIPTWCEDVVSFVNEKKPILRSASDIAAQVLKEDLFDLLGVLWSCAVRDQAPEGAALKLTAQGLSGVRDDQVTDDAFSSFIQSRRQEMRDASAAHRSIVFVMGHRNPDTDSVVSALAEAFRQHLIHGGDSVFVPVVQSAKLPAEVVELLGKGPSKSVILTSEEGYVEASQRGRPEWIMVDHNFGEEQQDARAIIDHHYPSDVSLRQQIPRRILFAGSTTALVAARLYGLGVEIPPRMAMVLQGAALMDTENRFVGKMTPFDDLIMDRLRESSPDSDESSYYRRLMKELISCYVPEELFIRDYKEDWCFFGFAVAKGILLLDDARSPVVGRLCELAAENNKSRNLPLTLVKIVDYDTDAETIRREKVYPVFMDGASAEFKEAAFKTIDAVIRHESPEDVQITKEPDSVEYWGVGTQLSRKKLAPVLDHVITAFNHYFYSPSTRLYFKRDFLRSDKRLEQLASRHGLKVHTTDEGVVVGNPAELKFYLQELGLQCATPAQYFKAYFDALEVNDERMAAHLTSSSYLETLDAIIENKEVLVEHPKIILTPDGFSYENGNRRKVPIPKGEPGLMDPKKIDPQTGLPTEVEDPRQYGTGLWRYWSPDSACSWVLRSTIFAYEIPALDLKFDFPEVLPRLSIRPCVERVVYPDVQIHLRKDSIVVDIKEKD